jgi:methionine salvage enolase-phosphatase E1
MRSYEKIASSVSKETSKFLFLSDVAKEVEAARTAGMQALLCEREGYLNAAGSNAHAIHDFNGIFSE